MSRHIPASKQKEKPAGNYKHIGKGINRLEDKRLITGSGKYIDDINVAGMAHAASLRSPFAHARIVSIDKAEAEALPGVILVMTGAELAEVTDILPCFSSPVVPQRCVAVDRVRHVGEPVAVVVAENRYIAEDACDLIEVDYEELPVVVDAEEAITMKGDAVLHPELGDTNVVVDHKNTWGPVNEDFEDADVVVKRRLSWPRGAGAPLEGGGAVASYSVGTGQFDIHANTQMYNFVFASLVAASLKAPATSVRISPVDNGGSFGSKVLISRVVVIAAALARASGRPVKYLEDRIDALTASDSHGNTCKYEAELAMKDGLMKSLRFRCVDDYGAYFQFGSSQHTGALAQIVGPYRINSVGMELIVVLTNKCQNGPYRGFGCECSNWLVERMVDAAVEELGVDPVEFRRKNYIQPEQFPYIIPTGNCYDSGDYEAVLNHALEISHYHEWQEKLKKMRAEGRYVGIGITACQERSTYSASEWWMRNDQPGFDLSSTPESVSITMDPEGIVRVTLYAPMIGTSPETVAATVVAEQLQLESTSQVVVNYATSDGNLKSVGPSGSRVTVMLTGACVGACSKIREKLILIGAHLLGEESSSLELRNGKVGVVGNEEKELSYAEIAVVAHFFRKSLPEGEEYDTGSLNAIHTYDHPFCTMPNEDRSDMGIFYPFMGHMVHIPVVEIDIETGQLSFLDYACVHDCGTIVNPPSLDGQIIGSTVNGIGSTLYEQLYYDENGQLLNSTLVDYLLPGVHEIPSEIRVGHIETPSPYTEYGVKGAGEGGRMGAPSAICQAVEDALRPLGVKVDELPLSPKRMRALIREAQQKLAS